MKLIELVDKLYKDNEDHNIAIINPISYEILTCGSCYHIKNELPLISLASMRLSPVLFSEAFLFDIKDLSEFELEDEELIIISQEVVYDEDLFCVQFYPKNMLLPTRHKRFINTYGIKLKNIVTVKDLNICCYHFINNSIYTDEVRLHAFERVPDMSYYCKGGGVYNDSNY